MNRDTLLGLYDRLSQLVDKLPGSIQKPILRELTPIRQVFLAQRPARIMLTGHPSPSVPEFLHGILEIIVETGESNHGWRSYRIAGQENRGEILLLDARSDTPLDHVRETVRHGAPDIVIHLQSTDGGTAALEAAAERLSLIAVDVPVVAVAAEGCDLGQLSAQIASARQFSVRRHIACLPSDMAENACLFLPDAARLEFARLFGAKKAQAEIAGSLLKSFTTVCGVIGLQPIPLADLPLLTALQSLMVGLIVYVSGKPANARLITEFLGALGLNIGAGILFRESARAIIKIVPLWGNAVSGFVAGAGTYAVGRAAISYFIEETPITETRKLFDRLLPSWDAFKRRRLPHLSKQKPPVLKDEDPD